eukprot:TRINITY_DN739_c0_g1_i1.p1 TRINITY_DN739_c0_g1~~TRINITY_DN739_c0_g1_i1.p1  ORF type:complete len:403 (+),score=169.37 TRINITY_DN739_c0_g1_i1:948-2156(+)
MIDVQFCFSSMEDGQYDAAVVILSSIKPIEIEGKAQDLVLHVHPIFFFFLLCAGIIKEYQFQSLITDSDFDQEKKKNNNGSPFIEIADLLEISDPQFDLLIQNLAEGLHSFAPELCSEGVNGSYFLRDSNGKIRAIFKPEDEEGTSQFNPKKTEMKDNKRGILSGEAATREVAAFLLDVENGRTFGVPSTHMIRISHPVFGTDSRGKSRVKTGSLQTFVSNDGAAWDIGSSAFPVDEVHKIAILDLILFNTDRHEGNILFKKEADSYSLIPIDHGFSLPDNLGGAWFDWMNYSQAKKPFSESSLEFINSFDLERNISLLSTHLAVRKECLRVMQISVTLLKRAAAAGLNAFQIGKFASRRNLEDPSDLENLVAKINEEMKEDCEELFLQRFAQELDRTFSLI